MFIKKAEGPHKTACAWRPHFWTTNVGEYVWAESLPCCHSESVKVGTDECRGSDIAQYDLGDEK